MEIRLVWPGRERLRGSSGTLGGDSFWLQCSASEAENLVVPRVTQEGQLGPGHPGSEPPAHLGPPVCFLVSRDLSSIVQMPWYYPHSGMWNAYCPFRELPTPVHVGSIEDVADVHIPEELRCGSKQERRPVTGMNLIGVDGCAGGWIAALRDPRGVIACRRITALAELFDDSVHPKVVAVDVPIGLPDSGARKCDKEARTLLGPRRSSVFPAPIRPILTARLHPEASTLRRQIEGKGVSLRAWAIVPKIIEVDCFLRTHARAREVVREVHPEVSFLFLNGGRPMIYPKTTAVGRAERLSILRTWGGSLVDDAMAWRTGVGCKADDMLDALVALWTAERIARGAAISIPAEPPVDKCGLRMEIMA
jgi:predicted RNase H-like nuclease